MNKFFEGTKKSGPFPVWAGFACAFFAFWSAFTFSRQLRTGNEDLKLPAVFLGCLVPKFLFSVIEWFQVRSERTSDKRAIVVLAVLGACFWIFFVYEFQVTHTHEKGKELEYKRLDPYYLGTLAFLALLSFSVALASESANRVLAGNVKLN